MRPFHELIFRAPIFVGLSPNIPEFVPSDSGTMVDGVQKKTCVLDPVDGRYITLSTKKNLFGYPTTPYIAHVAQLQKNGGVFT